MHKKIIFFLCTKIQKKIIWVKKIKMKKGIHNYLSYIFLTELVFVSRKNIREIKLSQRYKKGKITLIQSFFWRFNRRFWSIGSVFILKQNHHGITLVFFVKFHNKLDSMSKCVRVSYSKFGFLILVKKRKLFCYFH